MKKIWVFFPFLEYMALLTGSCEFKLSYMRPVK